MRVLIAGNFALVAVGVLLAQADPRDSVLQEPVLSVALPVAGTSSPVIAGSDRSAIAHHPSLERHSSAAVSVLDRRPDEDILSDDLTAVVKEYCVRCHNDRRLTGNLSLQDFEVAEVAGLAETGEKMISKLRVGMMPPPGRPIPGGDTLLALVEMLEQTLDKAAAKDPNPGSRSFQRLNRPEYEASIRDLLGLDVKAEEYLPPDTKSANFDNLADQQLLSPTLMDAYLRAATVISRLAIGNPNVTASETQYRVVRHASQLDRVEGAPFGTRGGTSVMHNFPADGEYYLEFTFPQNEGGAVFGGGRSALHTAEALEQIDISIDGEPLALLEIDRWLDSTDPNGAVLRVGPVFIRSGAYRVTAAFIRRMEGPLADLIRPHDWSQPTSGGNRYGFLLFPHLRDLVIVGPYNPTGVSETLPRQRVFTCRPTSHDEARPCAEEILSRLATQAFRRPVTTENLEELMSFYEHGTKLRGFEEGIRAGLEAILASPHFVFRVETQPAKVKAGENYRVGEFELASRLSYFLWATPPDEEILSLARQGRLSDRRVLEAQTRRMLADPRSEALATRFLAQWLRLPDLEEIHPHVPIYPDFHQQLKQAFRRETELLFYNLLKNDRSVLELFTADYTFVNERLAKHYGITGVVGEEFRRVQYQDDSHRRGILGHASVLTLTSVPARTSPVLRGKWVMEVILGAPPPPPPPGVPSLEETEGSTEEGLVLTTRDRMEIHRSNPTCNACHRYMDPLGLALDNFDVVGKWRTRENGMPLDTRGELYDGTLVSGPEDLLSALVEKRSIPILRNFTANLMTYALGRRVEYFDMPTVRRIVSVAEASDYDIASFVLGVVSSPAFQMRRAAAVTATANPTDNRNQ